MSNDINNLESIIPDASSEQMALFHQFFKLIEQYNSKINLISKSTVAHAGVKHFSDSYQGLSLIEGELEGIKTIFDFGAGNGFPGIIAAILFPSIQVVLVERDQRKSEFLKIAADQLSLANIDVHGGNVSDLRDESCDLIISRAMAPLPKFMLEARAVTAPRGKAFLFKGDYWSTEFSAIPAQLFDHWDVELFGSYELPGDEGARYIIKCERID